MAPAKRTRQLPQKSRRASALGLLVWEHGSSGGEIRLRARRRRGPILEAVVRILAKVPEGPLHADDRAVIAEHGADYPPLNESSLFFGVHDLRGVE